jgi:hypothetical protein
VTKQSKKSEVASDIRAIFNAANEESCLRLVSAIVMEVSEQWVSGRMYLRVK